MSEKASFFVFCMILVLLFTAVVFIGVYVGLNNCELGHPFVLTEVHNFCGECGEALRTKCPDCCCSYVTAPEYCIRCGYHFEDVSNGE